MKIKDTKFETISGSLGTVAGASSSGGNHLRKKIITNKVKNTKKSNINQYMKLANIAWKGLALDKRKKWNAYGQTLIRTNQTGHEVHQTGWNAFSTSYILMTQGGMNVDPIIASAPNQQGYLELKNMDIIHVASTGLNQLKNNNPYAIQTSVFISKKVKNTINNIGTNYQYLRNKRQIANGKYSLEPYIKQGRFFFKLNRIEINGAFSLPFFLKKDLQ